MANQSNPNLKFQQLPDAQVLALLNERAIDAQWDVNNAKSPKGKREAQDDLNLYGSAVEMIKKNNVHLTVNIAKIVERMDLNTASASDAKEQITKILRDSIKDAEEALQEREVANA